MPTLHNIEKTPWRSPLILNYNVWRWFQSSARGSTWMSKKHKKVFCIMKMRRGMKNWKLEMKGLSMKSLRLENNHFNTALKYANLIKALKFFVLCWILATCNQSTNMSYYVVNFLTPAISQLTCHIMLSTFWHLKSVN